MNSHYSSFHTLFTVKTYVFPLIIPRRKISCGEDILFWRCPSGRSLSVRHAFIVILQEYVLASEDGSHNVWLHCINCIWPFVTFKCT